MTDPLMSAVVVHWHDEANLRSLVAAWPADPRFELVIVDNSSTLEPLDGDRVKLLQGHGNVGFGAGLNLGLSATAAPLVLLLNSDIVPIEGSLEHLIEAFREFPMAAGIVPALESLDGQTQSQWQLQPLPTAWHVLMQSIGRGGARGPRVEPPAGSQVEQPAAAALALRRTVYEEIGGFDESFYPAWFEDVDLAARLSGAGHTLSYQPRARFKHVGGASVSVLGYGPFLWVFHRNLARYLGKHHGVGWSVLANLVSVGAGLLRLGGACFRRPRRARTRPEAFAGAATYLLGALTGWRRPRSYRQRFSRAESVVE